MAEALRSAPLSQRGTMNIKIVGHEENGTLLISVYDRDMRIVAQVETTRHRLVAGAYSQEPFSVELVDWKGWRS